MGPLEWAMLLVLSIIWGASFFFYAIAITGLPTLTIVFLRVAIASLVLWVIVIKSRLPVPNTVFRWSNFLLMGLLNNAIPFSLIIWAQHQVPSGLAAILNATTPFFTVLVAHVFTTDERLSWNRLAGVLIGLAGVVIMIGIDALAAGRGAPLVQLAILGAAVAYAFASVFGRRFAGSAPLVTAAGQTAGSSLILLPLVLVIDRPWTLQLPNASVWAAVLALALMCTSLAYVLYFTILKRAGAMNIVLVTFLVPVSAAVLGALFLGEHLGFQHGLGMCAIAVGLAFIDGRVIHIMKRATA